MQTVIIGDKVKLLPPFSSENIYVVKSIEGAYVTLYSEKEHKDLVIYIKCIKKLG
jgi:hypothetical protein